jgi:hypothetical protein
MTNRVSSGVPLRRAPVNSMKGFVVSSYLWPVTEKSSVSAMHSLTRCTHSSPWVPQSKLSTPTDVTYAYSATSTALHELPPSVSRAQARPCSASTASLGSTPASSGRAHPTGRRDGHRPWLSVDDRCGPVGRHIGGTAGEGQRCSNLVAMVQLDRRGEAPSRVTTCLVAKPLEVVRQQPAPA